MLEGFKIIDVDAENISEIGVFCIKNKKANGFKSKVDWYKSEINKGIKIKIAVDNENNQLGFIEYMPSEIAWRPIKAKNYLFIQCINVTSKKNRNKGIASELINECLKDAKVMKKDGVCTICSDGVWIANKTLFEKNEFIKGDVLGRFEIMYKNFNENVSNPEFNDYTKELKNYKGFNLLYADQCPWHEKSVNDIKISAKENNIDLKIKKITSPFQAQNSPSGFGTFALIYNGKLLSDHYLSKTRFENILKKN